MNQEAAITCMFVDIGGVLLSNGWDRHARKQVAARFALDLSELEERHHLVFETYETGKLTLDEYLDLVVFYQTTPVHPGAVPGMHLCADPTVPGDDRADAHTQGAAQPENPGRQQ